MQPKAPKGGIWSSVDGKWYDSGRFMPLSPTPYAMDKAEIERICSVIGWSLRHLSRMAGYSPTIAQRWGHEQAVPAEIERWLHEANAWFWAHPFPLPCEAARRARSSIDKAELGRLCDAVGWSLRQLSIKAGYSPSIAQRMGRDIEVPAEIEKWLRAADAWLAAHPVPQPKKAARGG